MLKRFVFFFWSIKISNESRNFGKCIRFLNSVCEFQAHLIDVIFIVWNKS